MKVLRRAQVIKKTRPPARPKAGAGWFDNHTGFYNNGPTFFRPNSAVRPGVRVTPAGNDKTSSTTTPENPEAKQSSQIWAYASEGTQLAVTLLVGIFIGYKIDARWNTSPWFTLGFAVLGIVLGLFNFLRRALKW